MTTYQALLLKLKQFAGAHKQIKRFGSDFNEQFDNFVNEGASFPVMYVSSVDATSQLNQLTYSVEIIIADLILEDRANVNAILNDCKLILNDIFIYYNSGNDNALHIEQEPILTPLNNYSVDNLAGARATFTFEVDTYGLCSIPIGEIAPTPEPECAPVEIYENDILVDTIPSGGEYRYDTDCPEPEPCEDATVNVNGTLFDTVESGDTLDIEVRKSTGNDLIGSKQGQYWRVGDSEVNVNSVKLTDVKATETLNITVVDSTDASVSVTLSGGNKITIPSLPCSGGGATSYSLVNHTTLNRNNPFGNTNRFTAINGTQTYTNGIALDWFQADDYAETVPMYGVSLLSATSLANHLAGEPYTLGSFNNFELIQVEDLFALVNPRASAVTDGLNYSPFNHQAATNASRVRSKTDYYASTTDNWVYAQTGILTAVVKTQTNQAIIKRIATYTELGL